MGAQNALHNPSTPFPRTHRGGGAALPKKAAWPDHEHWRSLDEVPVLTVHLPSARSPRAPPNAPGRPPACTPGRPDPGRVRGPHRPGGGDRVAIAPGLPGQPRCRPGRTGRPRQDRDRCDRRASRANTDIADQGPGRTRRRREPGGRTWRAESDSQSGGRNPGQHPVDTGGLAGHASRRLEFGKCLRDRVRLDDRQFVWTRQWE